MGDKIRACSNIISSRSHLQHLALAPICSAKLPIFKTPLTPPGSSGQTKSLSSSLKRNLRMGMKRNNTLYVAYAPEFDLCSYGACRDEALNNLTDEIQQQQKAEQGTGREPARPTGSTSPRADNRRGLKIPSVSKRTNNQADLKNS